MVEIRDGSFLELRLKEDEFTNQEVEKIKEEIKSSGQYEFVISAIKSYLTEEDNSLEELKELVDRNYSLLQDIKYNKATISSNNQVNYDQEKQQAKTDKALDLLNQF
ncbi:hypothetical protein [Halanaerobaculum tunisiense]